MTRFWLIRHGEPAAESRRRCYGSLDVGLSDRGRTQMASAAGYLKTAPISAIYASPRSRALESARILAGTRAAPVKTVEGFREMDFGNFEGLSYDEIAAEHPGLYRQWMETPTTVRFPHGESYSVMCARVLRSFERIRRKRQNQTVAIVSHGGVNRILIARVLQMPHHAIFRLAQDYACVNLLEFVDGFPAVRLLNYQP